MSSISLPNEKQIRHFFIANALATETTTPTFIATGSNGEAVLVNEEGLGTFSPNGSFMVVKKMLDGKVVFSDKIKFKNITYTRKTEPVTKVGKTNVVTLASVVSGAVYNASLKIHYANSEENFNTIMASHKATSTDTVTTVMTALAKQLGDNLAASVWTSTTAGGLDTIIAGTTVEKNKYFTLTQVAGALTVAEKDWILDGYVTGLKTFDQLMWNFEVFSYNDTANAAISKTVTNPVYPKNQGYQILELERYLVGHRAEFPGPDITLSFNRPYEASVSSTYYTLDLKYFNTSRNDQYQSDKMITIASTDELVIDAIIADIDAIINPV